MSRPADMRPARYYTAAILDRATALKPVARAREHLRALTAPDAPGVAPDGYPYPPASLRVRVIGGNGNAEGFYRGGRQNADALLQTLRLGGVNPGSLDAVLDFGCGCGRISRHLAGMWTLHGTDLNPKAAAWCAEHLPMTASTNGLTPPLDHPGHTFDLVYAVSVLTHLQEDTANAWISEWRRVLRPGGLLLFSTIGDQHRTGLNAGQKDRYDHGLPVVTKPGIEGMNSCVAHTPPVYVRGVLLDGLEVLAHVPGGELEDMPQDLWLARVRSDESRTSP